MLVSKREKKGRETRISTATGAPGRHCAGDQREQKQRNANTKTPRETKKQRTTKEK